jgi:hypothetical protein
MYIEPRAGANIRAALQLPLLRVAALELRKPHRIELDNRLFAQRTMRLVLARGRSAPLWTTAVAFLATWRYKAQGFAQGAAEAGG